MGKEQLVATTVRGLLELALPLGSGLCDGAFDLFLYLQERASFAGEIHFVEDDLYELSEYFGLQRSSKLFQHLLLAGHRLGADDVRAGDPGSFVVFEVQFSVSLLRPKPEGQRSDLGGAHVECLCRGGCGAGSRPVRHAGTRPDLNTPPASLLQGAHPRRLPRRWPEED